MVINGIVVLSQGFFMRGKNKEMNERIPLKYKNSNEQQNERNVPPINQQENLLPTEDFISLPKLLLHKKLEKLRHFTQ